MGVMEIIKSVLMLLAGLGVFLFGLKTMGDNLESAAGDKMRRLFNKISSNRIVGMGVGAGATAVIQSSSATTVMVVGFVNAGMMTLGQAAPIIMGANIGTTITAQISSLQGLGITWWIAAVGCIGAFMQMNKRNALQKIGIILCGLSMIFVGLELMSMAMVVFQKIPEFTAFFVNNTNPFLLILMGLGFTALIQSSSAATGILLSMSAIIPLKSIMFVILGVNMGTCITAILASIGASTNAKRASMIHFLFNMLGALIFLPIVAYAPIDTLLQDVFEGAAKQQIAMFHTIFNVSTTLLLLPFVKPLVFLATKMIPERKKVHGGEEVIENKPKFIDKLLLSTPVIALSQAEKEINNMASIATKNFNLSIESIIEGKTIDHETFKKREEYIDFLNHSITAYLVSISSNDISLKDEVMVASFYHVVSDIERVGDYAENLMEYAEELTKQKSTFSEQAIVEIRDMADKINTVMDVAMQAFNDKDLAMLKEVTRCEKLVDDCKLAYSMEHIKRLNANACTPSIGAIYINLLSNLERISDHIENIALSIKEYTLKPRKVDATVKKMDERSPKK